MKDNNGENPYYTEQWNSLKSFVLKRDKYRCALNGDGICTGGLTAHHIIYRKDKRVYESPPEDLITLCWKHHEELKKNDITKISSWLIDKFGYSPQEIFQLSSLFYCIVHDVRGILKKGGNDTEKEINRMSVNLMSDINVHVPLLLAIIQSSYNCSSKDELINRVVNILKDCKVDERTVVYTPRINESLQ